MGHSLSYFNFFLISLHRLNSIPFYGPIEDQLQSALSFSENDFPDYFYNSYDFLYSLYLSQTLIR